MFFLTPIPYFFNLHPTFFNPQKPIFVYLSLGVFVDVFGGGCYKLGKLLQQKLVNWSPQIVVKSEK